VSNQYAGTGRLSVELLEAVPTSSRATRACDPGRTPIPGSSSRQRDARRRARDKTGDPLVRNEVKALAHLLGHDSPHLHSLDDLRAADVKMGEELTARIRAGEADDGDWRQNVLAVVRRSVEDKLRIANPLTSRMNMLFANSRKEN